MSAIECNEWCPVCGGPIGDIRIEDSSGRFLGWERACVGECEGEEVQYLGQCDPEEEE